MFDRLMLLAKGKIIFFNEARLAVDYFSGIGYKCPELSNPADYFMVFCRQILPTIESRIELQLLEKFKATLDSPLERKEVEDAYYQRKDNLAKVKDRQEMPEPTSDKQQLTIDNREYQAVIQTIHGDGLSYHTYEDIGRYTVFPDQMRKRMFPSIMFGRYFNDEIKYNDTFGI